MQLRRTESVADCVLTSFLLVDPKYVLIRLFQAWLVRTIDDSRFAWMISVIRGPRVVFWFAVCYSEPIKGGAPCVLALGSCSLSSGHLRSLRSLASGAAAAARQRTCISFCEYKGT